MINKKALGSTLLLTAGFVLHINAAVAEDKALAASGADSVMLGNTCAGCHGTNGSSFGPASPSIAGMGKDTLVDAMKAYKEGTRSGTIMNRIAQGYADADFEAMGDFFSKQTLLVSAQNADAAKADAGRKLHKEYCEKCHVEEGTKDEDGAGVLAGQWMPYLHYAMEDFQSGAREMPKKMQKRIEKMVQKEGDGAIDNVIHFYGSRK
jgi:sulfide dehydrogenase cytochrome subunit